MIVSPQPPCHNRLKSLNSFSVSLLGFRDCRSDDRAEIDGRQSSCRKLRKDGRQCLEISARAILAVASDDCVGHCQLNCVSKASPTSDARSRGGDGILPLAGRFGSEDPERRARDEMTLKVEGVVNGGMHAEKTLGGAS